MKYRIGQGIDFHRLTEGRPLRLGGVDVPSEKGCEAHSDGDALIHAICDAMLGAAGLNDIGHYFPDTDQLYRGIDSMVLLEKTLSLVKDEGFSVGNIDSTVCLEKPKIAPYVPAMKKSIANIAGVNESAVSVKATTTEKMGFAGRGEGLFAIASVLLISSCPDR